MAQTWPRSIAAPRTRASAAAPGAYGARVRRLARVRIAPFLATVVMLQIIEKLRDSSAIALGTPLAWQAAFESLVFTTFMYPTTFAAIVLTEALGLRGWRHFAASFAGLVVAVAVAAGGMTLAFGLATPALVDANVIVSDRPGFHLANTFWIEVGANMLLVLYLAYREREQAATRAAQEASTQRASAERAVTAARLKVMQARVEPELLFGALSDVRDLYLRDSAAADGLLDDLIVYLRAALPHMRGDASTLGREAALAVAYAKVLPAARRGELTAESAIDERMQALPFPPMVLLPLVRSAAESAAATITIELEGDGDAATGVVVRVAPNQPARWDDARLDAVRAAMIHGFGPGATLCADGAAVVARW